MNEWTSGIAPCPNCGETLRCNLGVYDVPAASDWVQVHCGGCGLGGPVSKSHDAAIEKWRLMPRYEMIYPRQLPFLNNNDIIVEVGPSPRNCWALSKHGNNYIFTPSNRYGEVIRHPQHSAYSFEWDHEKEDELPYDALLWCRHKFVGGMTVGFDELAYPCSHCWKWNYSCSHQLVCDRVTCDLALSARQEPFDIERFERDRARRAR